MSEHTSVTALAVLPTPEDRTSISHILRGSKWQLKLAETLCNVKKAFLDPTIAVIVSVSILADGHGWIDVLGTIHTDSSRRPLIVVSRRLGAVLWGEVLSRGGYDVLVKPFNPADRSIPEQGIPRRSVPR